MFQGSDDIKSYRRSIIFSLSNSIFRIVTPVLTSQTLFAPSILTIKRAKYVKVAQGSTSKTGCFRVEIQSIAARSSNDRQTRRREFQLNEVE